MTPKDIIMDTLHKECIVDPYDILFDDGNMNVIEIVNLKSSIKIINEFVIQFFTNRFSIELKQYNNDALKASDDFICKKNLELFRLYVEEIFPLQYKLDMLKVNKEEYRWIMNYLRGIHLSLCEKIKNGSSIH
jgi:hypothetical protein